MINFAVMQIVSGCLIQPVIKNYLMANKIMGCRNLFQPAIQAPVLEIIRGSEPVDIRHQASHQRRIEYPLTPKL